MDGVKELQPHQQRVVTENQELDDKLMKLEAFFRGTIYPTLSQGECDRLSRQAAAMQQYSDILGERIAAF